MAGGDREIGEDTETHARLRGGMVTRGSDQRVGVTHVTGHDRLGHDEGAADRERSDLEHALTERARAITRVAALGQVTLLADPSDVLGGMRPQQLLVGGRAGRAGRELLEHTADGDQRVHPGPGLRVLEVLQRLQTRSGLRREQPGVGPLIAPAEHLVPDVARCHVPRLGTDELRADRAEHLRESDTVENDERQASVRRQVSVGSASGRPPPTGRRGSAHGHRARSTAGDRSPRGHGR